MMLPNLDDHQRNLRALLLALLALIGMAIVFLIVGCRQLPVLKGEFHDAKAEQARVDSKQSDRIADVVALEDGMGQVVAAIAPEEVKPQVQAVRSRITNVRAQADAQAAQHRDRADREERKLEDLNAQPGAGAWIGSLLTGNWSGLLDLIMGALGLGGAAVAVRERGKARKTISEVVEGVEGFVEAEPTKAEVLKVHLSRSMDRKTKDLVKAVKANRKA